MTQLEIVKDQLLNTGKVSRNWCLQQRLTRLASRISDLKRLGLEIEGASVHTEYGTDYVYTLKNMEIKKDPQPMTDDEKIKRWKPTIGKGNPNEALKYRNNYLLTEGKTKEFWKKEFFKVI